MNLFANPDIFGNTELSAPPSNEPNPFAPFAMVINVPDILLPMDLTTPVIFGNFPEIAGPIFPNEAAIPFGISAKSFTSLAAGGLPFGFCIRLCAEVCRTHRVVAQQIFAAACQRDASGLEHVADIGDLERHVRVLLDEQNGHALLVDLLNDGENVAHDHSHLAHAGCPDFKPVI